MQLRWQADFDPFLVDLEHDRRKPSDEVLEQIAKVLKVDSTCCIFWRENFQPTSLRRASIALKSSPLPGRPSGVK